MTPLKLFLFFAVLQPFSALTLDGMYNFLDLVWLWLIVKRTPQNPPKNKRRPS